MAVLVVFSQGFLREDTCHDLVKAFRQVERAVLYNQPPNP